MLLAVALYIIAGVLWPLVYLRWVVPQFQALLQTQMWLRPLVWALGGTAWAAVGSFVATLLGQAILPLVLYLVLVRRRGLSPLLRRPPQPVAAIAVSLLLVAGAVIFASTQDTQMGLADAINLVLLVAVVGPCEEWSYRGVLTRVAADRIGIVPAAVAVSAAFGFAHMFEGLFVLHLSLGNGTAWSYMGSAALTGLALTWIAWRSGSILWAAAVHGIDDWLQSVIWGGV